MPSNLHEVLVEMFRAQPALAADLLSGPLGLALPEYDTARVAPGTYTELPATEYRADNVIVLHAGGAPVLAVIVEIQLNRDADKRWVWPIYLAGLRARLRCPTLLLVISLDPAIARWCATPIALGPGTTMTPWVIGPDLLPRITDPALAEQTPELAVLSAIAHGGEQPDSPDNPRGGQQVLDALMGAFAGVEPDRAALYYDVVLAALPIAASRYLEALMTATNYEYQSEFARRYVAEGEAKGEAKGKAKGKAEDVLAVLDARDITVPAEVRTRIGECADIDLLDAWLRRAVTANSANDLFT